jgi:hypothetical protein
MRVEEYSMGSMLFSFFVMPFIVGIVAAIVILPSAWLFDHIFYHTGVGVVVRETFVETFLTSSSDEDSNPCFPLSYSEEC